MTRTSKGKRRTPAPLFAKIFGCFALFTLIVIVLLWLFQTVFLSSIYGAVKRHDMKNCAEELAECAVEGTLDDNVIAVSNRYNCCISVFRIENQFGVRIASSHIQTTCMIHNMDSDALLNDLYTNAKESGTYITRIDIDFEGADKLISPEREGSDTPSTVILAKVVTEDNIDYLVLVDSEIVPLGATTRSLQYQLIIITAILLVISAVVSLIISRRLSKPISKMTKEASLLAKGNYDVNFEGSSFREVKELGDTLNYAAGELSKLDTMQKELIANISHDLRTPLTLIRGYSEVMRDIPGEMNGENIQLIIDETTRLSSLVTDLLDLSRLNEGGQTITPERFSLTEAVKETLNRYSHLTERDGYVIDFDYSDDVFVFADKTRILQVIYNLVNNAVNYTGDDRHVTVRQTVSNGKVRISVIDSGAGIPEDQLPMIWERYYKVGGFHNRGKVGTGLGLSIVKNVLKKHNADFGVTSHLGEGSTFWFELPLSE